MVTTTKLENERLDKLKNLSDYELTEYIENLVLDAYGGFKGDGIVDNTDMETAMDKLDEIINIILKKNPRCNIKNVIKDREFRYMNLAYSSAILHMENIKISLADSIRFTIDVTKLEMFYLELKTLVRIYYENYSNYGFMENLLMDLSDDGLSVDYDIHEKYTKNHNYRFNQHLMFNLNIEIKVMVKIILDEITKLDKKYLMDDSPEIDEYIDKIHENIKNFYKCSSDFEIAAYNQTGFLDANLESIQSVKNDAAKQYKVYSDVRNEILDFLDGDGFAEISAERFEKLKKSNPDVYPDFDEWKSKEPKYDVRNAKFIYPE